MGAEKDIRTINSAVNTSGGGFYHRTFMNMPGGIPSIKKAVLVSSFQYDMNKYMVAETMDEYALYYAEAYY